MSDRIPASLLAICALLYFLDHSVIALAIRYIGLLHPLLSWLHFISWLSPKLSLIVDPIDYASTTVIHSLFLFVIQWLVELDDYFRLNDETLQVGITEIKRYYNGDPIQAYEQLPV
eukprot:NODE_303_length_11391_cov_0.177028.p5 type:complete len:116 gc:universal NODE_303_length_11391_cov_0.177028:950-603(-)